MARSHHRRPMTWPILGGVILIVVSVLVAVVVTPNKQQSPRNTVVADPSAITITTEDGIALSATMKYPVRNALSPAVILLHAYGQDRHQWDQVIPNFLDAGIAVLSYDMRGFGESRITAIPATTDEHLNSLPNDLPAVLAYLRQQPSIDASRISVIGAGIGANVAFVVSGSNLGVHRTVLLTPSPLSQALDGSTVNDFLPSHILGIAGTEDLDALRALMERVKVEREILEIDGGSQGVSLVTNEQTLQRVIGWVKS